MNNKYYQSIINRAPFGYGFHEIILDDSGIPYDYYFREVNQAFEKITGLNASEILGKTAREVLPGIEKSEFNWIGLYGKIAMTGVTEEFEQYSQQLQRWYQVQISSPERGFFSTIFTEITKHKEEILNFRQTEETFNDNATDLAQSLIQTANVIIIGLNDAGEIDMMNEAAEKITGYTFAEIKGSNWFEKLVPKEKYPQVWEEFISITQSGQMPRTLENPIQTKSGEELYISWQNGLYRKGGKVEGTISIGIDITESKKSKEVLLNYSRQNQLILNAAAEGILGLDMKGNHTFMNHAACRMLGCSVGELIGKHSHKSWHHTKSDGSVYPEEECNILTTLRNGAELRIADDIFWRKDGTSFPVEYFSTPIYENGSVVGAVVTFNDISERKRIEIEKEVQAEIVHGVTSTADLYELLKLIHQALKKMIYAENCFFALHDEDTGLFNIPYFVDQLDTVPLPESMTKSCTAYVFRMGNPMVIDNYLFEQLKENNEVESVGSNSPSWIGVPLKTSDRTIGILVLQHYEKEHVYDNDHLRFLNSIASQVANVIERKRAEEELKKSFSLLTATLESTADGILVIDKKGKVSSFNKKFIELWQIPESIISTRDDNKILSFVLEQLKDPESFLSKVHELYLNEQEISFDLLEFKDGRTFERFSQSQMFNGRSLGRVWSFRDITERKVAEELILNNEKRAILQRAGIASLVIDQSFIDINLSVALDRTSKVLAETLGVARASIWNLTIDQSELKCLSLHDTINKSHNSGAILKPEDFPSYFSAIIEENRIYAEDVQNDPRTRELTEIYLKPLGITSMLDAGIIIEGKLKGVVCCEHIGPMRKWQSDEESFISSIAAIIAQLFINDRRKQVEKALMESESDLRTLNATKNKFFSIIAHDLRGPFNNIVYISSLIGEALKIGDIKSLKQYSDLLETSSQRVNELLINLLEWAHSQTGGIKFYPKPFRLGRLIDDIFLLYEESAAKKSISFYHSVPNTLQVVADESMLNTILRNLIGNAVKFSVTGGKIEVKTAVSHSGLTISVRDNGIGMEPKMLEDLFKLGSNTGRTGTGGEPSSGLGLILCKEFVELHGGNIWVESNNDITSQDKGSVFYFSIPPIII